MPGTEMDPSVTIGPAQLQVEPGGQVRTTVTVRNQGQIVDGFRLTVLGDGLPDWAQVDPPEVRALPGETARATVTFHPPGGTATTGGAYPFGVLATSTVDASRSAAAEGDLEVGAFARVSATLAPRTATGRWRARYDLTVTNRGNRPARLRLTTDATGIADEHLAFLLMPATLTLPVGGVGHSRLRVRVRRPRLRGATARLPFQIRCQPDDVDVPEESTGHPGEAADAIFAQRPILSRLVTGLALLVVAGLTAAFILAVRGHPGPSAGLADGPPPTPSLTATLLAGDQVQLSWPAIGHVDTYKLLVPALNMTQAVDGELAGYLVTGLHAATSYCFELRAVRGTQISGLANSCLTTLPAPPAPVSPSLPPSARSSATAVSAVTSPLPPSSTLPVSSVSSASSGPVSPSSALPVSAVLSSPAPGSAAPLSAPVSCVPAGTAPGADARTPQFGAGQWIAVDAAAVWPVTTDPQATQALSTAAQVKVTAGTAAVLDSKQLQLTDAAAAQESWVVYVGAFTSWDSANCFCQHQTWKTFCVPYSAAPATPAAPSARRS